MGAVHYGARGDRGLPAAALALANVARFEHVKRMASTFGANEPIREAFPEQIIPANILCCKPCTKVFEGNLRCLCHLEAPLIL